MRIHHLLPRSQANGPGFRFVVWVQGCSRRCQGCFNPGTHDHNGGYEVSVSEIIAQIPFDRVDGITISGGEPFEQTEELAVLLEETGRRGLDRLVYTGFGYEELNGRENHHIAKCLSLIDILIDGPYEKDFPPIMPWTGSRNQRVLQLDHGKIEKEYGTGDVQMAENINGERLRLATFGAGNRAMRSIDPCPKCGGEKTAQSRRRLRFFGARGRESARSANRVLGEVQPDTSAIINHI